MKPFLSQSEDDGSLQTLGRASAQIVHDLKNQLNSLKLYATFLRKRLERNERPEDELETINKLIGGLDRADTDLSTLVKYGEPLELRKQPGIDLQKIISGVTASLSQAPRATGDLARSIVLNSDSTPLVGEFDSAVLTDALKSISVGASRMLAATADGGLLVINLKQALEPEKAAMIEWRGLKVLDHDPFRSFAGSDEIRMSLAAKMIEAHGGSVEYQPGALHVRLPLAS